MKNCRLLTKSCPLYFQVSLGKASTLCAFQSVLVALQMGKSFFFNLGFGLISQGKEPRDASRTAMLQFWSMYGISPRVCAGLWAIVYEHGVPHACKPVHLMWTLLFLTLYSTEYQLAMMVRADEKTIQKWVWMIIFALDACQDKYVSGFVSYFYFLFASTNSFPLCFTTDKMGRSLHWIQRRCMYGFQRLC